MLISLLPLSLSLSLQKHISNNYNTLYYHYIVNHNFHKKNFAYILSLELLYWIGSEIPNLTKKYSCSGSGSQHEFKGNDNRILMKWYNWPCSAIEDPCSVNGGLNALCSMSSLKVRRVKTLDTAEENCWGTLCHITVFRFQCGANFLASVTFFCILKRPGI